MELMEKLKILADSAKYDASCSSSGSERSFDYGGIGSPTAAGCCHAFSADGRCISLLKVLFTNYCINDCKYCHNRCSNDIPHAAFTLKKLRVVLKRAAYFITCRGKYMYSAFKMDYGFIYDALTHQSAMLPAVRGAEQLSFFSGYDSLIPPPQEKTSATTGDL